MSYWAGLALNMILTAGTGFADPDGYAHCCNNQFCDKTLLKQSAC